MLVAAPGATIPVGFYRITPTPGLLCDLPGVPPTPVLPYTFHFITACALGGSPNPADVTDIGNTGSGPDGQVTVDDIIAFVNAFGDGEGCPGPDVVPEGPCPSPFRCNLADITSIGIVDANGTAMCGDGQLTVDDIIHFFNSFSEGCDD